MSKNKISKTDQKLVKLLEEFQCHSVLYNTQHFQHQDKSIREDHWRKIAFKVKINTVDVKRKMAVLIKKFIAEYRKGKSDWIFYDKMQFLKEYLDLNYNEMGEDARENETLKRSTDQGEIKMQEEPEESEEQFVLINEVDEEKAVDYKQVEYI
jgi:hypothetical protein